LQGQAAFPHQAVTPEKIYRAELGCQCEYNTCAENAEQNLVVSANVLQLPYVAANNAQLKQANALRQVGACLVCAGCSLRVRSEDPSVAAVAFMSV
jgi:hypothetical protein